MWGFGSLQPASLVLPLQRVQIEPISCQGRGCDGFTVVVGSHKA